MSSVFGGAFLFIVSLTQTAMFLESIECPYGIGSAILFAVGTLSIVAILAFVLKVSDMVGSWLIEHLNLEE